MTTRERAEKKARQARWAEQNRAELKAARDIRIAAAGGIEVVRARQAAEAAKLAKIYGHMAIAGYRASGECDNPEGCNDPSCKCNHG